MIEARSKEGSVLGAAGHCLASFDKLPVPLQDKRHQISVRSPVGPTISTDRQLLIVGPGFFMRALLFAGVFLCGLLPGLSLAAATNTSGRFSEVWSLDLAGALPKDMEKAAFAKTQNVGSVPCSNGIAYFSEGGDANGGRSIASFVCHRNNDRNSALWVIYLPEYPSAFFDERRMVGIDCTLAGDGWRCKKRVKMISPFDERIDPQRKRPNADATKYIRIY